MKLFVATVVIFYSIVDAHAAALPDGVYDGEMAVENSAIMGIVDESSLPELNRPKRFSCDVFSFQSAWVSPNHSVCAMKCMGMGYRGGACQGTACVCRGERIFG